MCARRRALDVDQDGTGSPRAMKFRTRLLISFGWVLVAARVRWIRREMSRQLTGQYEQRCQALVTDQRGYRAEGDRWRASRR